MAKRPSVKEILEAARRGGPAKPAEAPSAPSEPEAERAAAEEDSGAATAAEEGTGVAGGARVVIEPEAPTRPAPATAVPTPSTLGRPLTLKEKLAAARAGGAAQTAPAAPAKPKAPVTAAETVEEAAPVEEPQAAPAAAAAAAPLGRPMTLQEKLAAARSGGAKPASAAGAAKTTAAKPAAAAAGKTQAARVLPPLERMTDPRDLAEAARQASAKKAKELAARTAESAPAKPKPAPAKAKPQTVPPKPSRELAASALPDTSRRGFFLGGVFISWALAWLVVAWTTFTAGLSVMTLMTVRFMFPNVLAEPPSTIKIGVLSDFAQEDVSERFKSAYGFWVVRSAKYTGTDILYALQSICTHLGCPPNWLASEQKFKCPCHGSGFYITGINFEGPAPRPLERFRVTFADDGQTILVDKSQRFQQELDQWSDPNSFIPA
jgi:cytochrome b6-f complex iron-sulfur subunit